MEKIKLMICIGLIFTFIGYSNAVESAQKGAKTAKEPKGIIKVKGFYIGMNIDEVPTILKKHFPELEIPEVFEVNGTYRIEAGNLLSYAMFIAGQDKKVIRIAFSGGFVNDLFNVADMKASEFADTFIKSYNISNADIEMGEECKVTGGEICYVYRSTNGFKVIIGTNDISKTLVIDWIPTTKGERKFD